MSHIELKITESPWHCPKPEEIEFIQGSSSLCQAYTNNDQVLKSWMFAIDFNDQDDMVPSMNTPAWLGRPGYHTQRRAGTRNYIQK